VGVGDGDLPNTDVAGHGAQEFAECEGDDELNVVSPLHVCIFPDVEEIEEGSRVDCDGQQLNHCDGHWIRKLA
jgi:hypothetical protein